MQLATLVGEGRSLAAFLKQAPQDEEAVTSFLDAYGTAPEASLAAATDIINAEVYQTEQGATTAAGRYVLSLPDDSLRIVADRLFQGNIVSFLISHVPHRLTEIYDSFLVEYFGGQIVLSPDNCRLLLEFDADQFAPGVRRVMRDYEAWDGRYLSTLIALAQQGHADRDEVSEKCQEVLVDPERSAPIYREQAFEWLIANHDTTTQETLLRLVRQRSYPREFLQRIATALEEDATPVIVAAAQNLSNPANCLTALELLTQQPRVDEELLDRLFRDCFASLDTDNTPRLLALVRRWQPRRLVAELWQRTTSKSKQVREAAARAIGALGETELDKTTEMLKAKRATSRAIAVKILGEIGTPQAHASLESALEAEKDEAVRDELLKVLQAYWEASGRVFTKEEIRARVRRLEGKLQQPIRDWIDESQLAVLRYAADQTPLSLTETRYLLLRQSRCSEIRPDVEVEPLYAMLDMPSAQAFADTLLRLFRRSEMAASDRWVLAIVGLLGGDAQVSPMMKLVRSWAESRRGKMGEYAAQALALNDSDTALCAVHTLAIRYRAKQKNIGAAAEAAFADAAERNGLTVDELGDRAVPWLGFEPGAPRVVADGERRLEVRVTPEFKLTYRDIAKNKLLANLPSRFAPEIKSEFKILRANLREVVKGQLLRVENLMVRQFRWEIDAWRKLYLAHPLLTPFALRLVWGLYENETRVATFRALNDLTLTNAYDENVDLPINDSRSSSHHISILHALELTNQERHDWLEHLNDYNIKSPFPQVDRHVYPFRPEHTGRKFGRDMVDCQLNGMTFRGRAEKLGWQRGSVIDGGCVTAYRKSFQGAGVDVILKVEHLYMGMERDHEITLGTFCFVKQGDVEFGSYVYDEPSRPNDARLISLEQVPPIVYSETLGDLNRIYPRDQEATS